MYSEWEFRQINALLTKLQIQEPEHNLEAEENCWCHPRVEEINDAKLIIHRTLREIVSGIPESELEKLDKHA